MTQPPSDAAGQPPKGALRIIFFVVFMDLLGFGIIIPLLPLIAEDYKASVFDVGLLFTIYSVCQFAAAPLLGSLSDRYGRRGVLVFSQLGSALGYLLLGIVMTFKWTHPGYALLLIYLSRLIDGLSGGNISTAQAYVSDVTTRQTRAGGMAVLGAAFGFGFAIGPAFASLLVTVHPALPGYGAALMSLGAMVLTFFRLPESRIHKPADASSWLHPSQFTPILRHSRLLQLLLISFISMIAFSMFESMIALFLNDAHTFAFSPAKVGLYYTYVGVVILVVQGGFIGRLSRRVGEWPLATTGPLFIALGMALLAITGYRPLLVLLLLGGGFNAIGRSLQTPTLFALISHNSDVKQQGLVFGMNQGMLSIARMIGPIAGALAFHVWIGGPFAVGAVIVLCASLWTAGLSRKRQPLDAQPVTSGDAAQSQVVDVGG